MSAEHRRELASRLIIAVAVDELAKRSHTVAHIGVHILYRRHCRDVFERLSVPRRAVDSEYVMIRLADAHARRKLAAAQERAHGIDRGLAHRARKILARERRRYARALARTVYGEQNVLAARRYGKIRPLRIVGRFSAVRLDAGAKPRRRKQFFQRRRDVFHQRLPAAANAPSISAIISSAFSSPTLSLISDGDMPAAVRSASES